MILNKSGRMAFYVVSLLLALTVLVIMVSFFYIGSDSTTSKAVDATKPITEYTNTSNLIDGGLFGGDAGTERQEVRLLASTYKNVTDNVVSCIQATEIQSGRFSLQLQQANDIPQIFIGIYGNQGPGTSARIELPERYRLCMATVQVGEDVSEPTFSFVSGTQNTEIPIFNGSITVEQNVRQITNEENEIISYELDDAGFFVAYNPQTMCYIKYVFASQDAFENKKLSELRALAFSAIQNDERYQGGICETT